VCNSEPTMNVFKTPSPQPIAPVLLQNLQQPLPPQLPPMMQPESVPLAQQPSQQNPPQQQEGVQENPTKVVLGVYLDKENKRVMKQMDDGSQLYIGLDQAHLQVANTLMNGQAPSNQNITQTFDEWKRVMDRHSAQLSERGVGMVNDVKILLDSVNKAVVSKNKDDMFQKLVNNVNTNRKQSVVLQTVKHNNKGKIQRMKQRLRRSKMSQTDPNQPPVEDELKKKLQTESSELLQDIQSMVLFVIKSKDFRRLIIDTVILLQSMARRFDRQYGDQITESISKDLMKPSESSASTADDRIVNPTMNNSAVKDLSHQILSAPKNSLIDEQEMKKMEELLKAIVETLTKKPEYLRMMRKLFTLYDKVEMTVKKQSTDLKTTYEPTIQQESQDYQKMLADMYVMIGQFCGHQELTQLRSKVYELYTMFSKDELAKNYLKELRNFLINCGENPSVKPDERQEQIKKLILDGRAAFDSEREVYQNHFKELRIILKSMMKYMKNDPDRKDISDKFGSLVKHMIMDESGKPDIFRAQESVQQMKMLMSSLLNEQLKSLPLPYIQYNASKFAASFSSMSLNSSGIMPEHFNVRTTSKLDMAPATPSANSFVHLMQLEVDRVKLDVNNAYYQIQHKKFASLKDSGIVDVSITGQKGLSLTVGFKMTVTGSTVRAEVRTAKCSIDKLRFNFKRAEHKVLDKMATKLFSGLIKRKICDAISEKLREALQVACTKLNEAAAKREARLKQELSTRPQKVAEMMNQKMKIVYDQTKDLTLHDVTTKLKTTVKERRELVQGKLNNLATLDSSEQVENQPHEKELVVIVSNEPITTVEKTA